MNQSLFVFGRLL